MLQGIILIQVYLFGLQLTDVPTWKHMEIYLCWHFSGLDNRCFTKQNIFI